MSWWTKLRNGLETGASVVANYFYPGVGMLAPFINSKGSQQQLNTDWGRGAMLLSGLGGGLAGNFANYGTTANAVMGAEGGAWPSAFAGSAGAAGAGAGVGGGASGYGGDTIFGGGGAEGGMSGNFGGAANSPFGVQPNGYDFGAYPSGTGYGGADPNAMANAQDLIKGGMDPTEAYRQAGVSGPQVDTTGAAPTYAGQGPPVGVPDYSGQSITRIEPGVAPGPAQGTNPQQVAAAKQAGAMPWGSFGNIANVASGIYGLAQSQQMANAAKEAQAAADPFAQYRKYYADQMQALQNDPSTLSRLPGYQAGQQAIMRSMAAQGYTGSGNMMAAMQKYGGDFYNQTMDRYAALAGAGANPATAAQIGLGGRQYGLELAGRSLGTLGYAGMMANNNPYDYNRYGNYGQQQQPPQYNRPSWMGP